MPSYSIYYSDMILLQLTLKDRSQCCVFAEPYLSAWIGKNRGLFNKDMSFRSSMGDLHLFSKILQISLVFVYSGFSVINCSTALIKTQIFGSTVTDLHFQVMYKQRNSCLSSFIHADLFSKGHSAAEDTAFTVPGQVYKA